MIIEVDVMLILLNPFSFVQRSLEVLIKAAFWCEKVKRCLPRCQGSRGCHDGEMDGHVGEVDSNVGFSQCHEPPIFLGMVNIPTIELVMTGGWYT